MIPLGRPITLLAGKKSRDELIGDKLLVIIARLISAQHGRELINSRESDRLNDEKII